jgi:hypothetical protein
MSHQWMLLVSAIAGFVVAASAQSWYVSRVMDRMFDAESHIETIEQWSKLTRQDVAGVMVTLGVTNGLLGAIVAVLLFR